MDTTPKEAYKVSLVKYVADIFLHNDL